MAEDWTYATDFDSFDGTSPRTAKIFHFVRRRRWVYQADSETSNSQKARQSEAGLSSATDSKDDKKKPARQVHNDCNHIFKNNIQPK
jgi:hypothetical protein